MARPKIISLYTGAGGLDYGFEAAGFDTSVAVEFNHDACETVRRNRPDWHPIERSIFEVPTEEMLEVAGLKKKEAALVVGGPPCQPFSKSGYWARGDSLRLDDPRSDTLGAYMRVVEEALPQAFLLENVGGLAFEGKDEGLQLVLRRIEEINKKTRSNYKPVFKVVKAAEYGVPQIRERFIMVAQRDGKQFQFPSPTHAEQNEDSLLPGMGLPGYRTAWDALADVKPEPGEDVAAKGRWAELLPSIPEGQNYLWHTDRRGGLPLFGWRTRYWGFMLKLAKAMPSWTVQAQPGPAIGPFHWDNRRLSMRELCRIQTFPDDVVIFGGKVSVVRQVGNAVPSLLTEVLGRAIRTQLLGLRPLKTGLKLLPPSRGPVPPPEPVEPVAEKFRHLVGAHKPHPGTGKGKAAKARAKAERQQRVA